MRARRSLFSRAFGRIGPRCGRSRKARRLIPVSGYYESQDTPTRKQPWYFTARDGSPALTIAGLWDEWQDKDSDKPLKSCTMIITEPNKFVAEVHDRMPVLLAEKDMA
jgi:putative SOS response-associated peptidase YedK